MDCTDCGACCIGTTVEITYKDLIYVHPDAYEKQGGRLFLKRVDNHCINFDPETRRCKDYDGRPTVCREFAPGSGTCRFLRALQRISDPEDLAA